MTDTTYYTSTNTTDTLPTFRDNVHVSLAQARMRTWTSYTADQTLVTTEDYVDVDATSGAVTIDLPASPVEGHEYVIRKSDGGGNAVTVDGNGKNIDGSATASLSSQYDRIRVSYNGTEWARVD